MKRSLSLCLALLLIVATIPIGVFTASAEGATTEAFFATGYTNTDATYRYADVIDTTISGVTPDFGVVVKSEHNASTITATDNKTYDLGTKFGASFLAWFRQDNYRGYADVNIGDLTIRVAREEENGDALSDYNVNTANVRVLALYKGTEVANSGTIGASGLNTNDKNAFDSIIAYIPEGQEKSWISSSPSTKLTRRAIQVDVVFDNGVLTVEVCKRNGSDADAPYDDVITTLTATLADTDLGTAQGLSVTTGAKVGAWSTEMFIGRGELTTYAAAEPVTYDYNWASDHIRVSAETDCLLLGEEATFIVALNGAPNNRAVAIALTPDDKVTVTSAQWLTKDALLTNFDMPLLKGAVAYDVTQNFNRSIFSFTVQGAAVGTSTMTVNVQLKDADGSFSETMSFDLSVLVGTGIPGDVDNDGEVTDEDAIYLLLYTFFPDEYPITNPMNFDFDDDGYITDEDAIYLLLYTFFPDEYPIS